MVELVASEDAIANKKYLYTYKFGADYDVISPNTSRHLLAVGTKLEALEDDTRLFCVLSKDDNFEIDVLDIPVGETKTINQKNQEKQLNQKTRKTGKTIRKKRKIQKKHENQEKTIHLRHL